LAVASERAELAATSAVTLSVRHAAAEAGKSAAQQAAAAAAAAAKRETDQLATLMVTMLTGCRTELKRLADAFAALKTRRQTSDQVSSSVLCCCIIAQSLRSNIMLHHATSGFCCSERASERASASDTD